MTPRMPKPEADDHERVAIPLDPVEALRALLAVDPDAAPATSDGEPPSEPAEPDS